MESLVLQHRVRLFLSAEYVDRWSGQTFEINEIYQAYSKISLKYCDPNPQIVWLFLRNCTDNTETGKSMYLLILNVIQFVVVKLSNIKWIFNLCFNTMHK